MKNLSKSSTAATRPAVHGAVRRRLPLVALAATALLSACSSYVSENQKGEADVVQKIQKIEQRTADATQASKAVRKTDRPANVRVRDGIYLGEQGATRFRGAPLPQAIEGPDGVVISSPGDITIAQFAVMFEQATGIRVDFSDLRAYAPGAVAASVDAPEPIEGSIPPSASLSPAIAGQLLDGKFDLRFRGPASRLLDMVSNRVGADWEYRSGIVRFTGPKTLSYTIWTLPVVMGTQTSIGDGGGDGGDGGSGVFGSSAPATTTANYAYDYWQNFETGLAAIMAESSASYAVNKASGSLVVTASRAMHERVAEFVERENARLSRQVAVRIDIVAFDAIDTDERSMDLAAALTGIFDNLGISVASTPAAIANAATLGMSITGGDADGTKLFVNALSTFGRTTVETSSSMVATNNMPSPISISSDRAYLASVSSTLDDAGNRTTALESGIITTGLNAVVTPRIMSSGEVFVNYSLNISELREIEEFSSPDGLSAVQLPLVNNRNIIQNVTLRSGDTAVIASYDSEGGSLDSSGPFNAAAWGAGGAAGWNNNSVRVLVLMTPVVLETQNFPH